MSASAAMSHPPTMGVVLAGGRARRMGGGDKPLLTLGSETLLAHVVKRLAPQCKGLVLNANGDPARFASFELPVVADSIPGHAGPLAGILAALDWAAVNRPGLGWVASVPGDTPFIPGDVVSRLHQAREAAGAALACATSGGRLHPALGLWPVELREDLRDALVEKDVRSVRAWAGGHGLAEASWPDLPFDPFLNINTPEQLNAAQAMVELGLVEL